VAERQSIFTFRVILLLIIFIVLVPFLPLLVSGRWGWWEAWVYALVCVLSFIISRALIARRNPDLLAERGKFMQHDNTQSWNKYLAPLLSLGAGLLPLAAGLEARFTIPHPFNLMVKIAALFFFLTGMVWASYALLENRYFSGMVRLQTERGHQVVSGGPYGCMRHPGYAGGLLTYLATPFILDSCWAFLPAGLLLVVLVIRTRLEDQFLQTELPGYREYAQRVRYRLIPGIW
jgi:protein-S-isoprenylcysteine O-methyltransferase Ste14